MKNFIRNGDSVAWTNGTGSNVISGQVVVLEAQLAVAAQDIAIGETGVLNLKGVFEVKKKTGVVFAIGDLLYWHATDGLTKTNTDKLAGMCFQAQLTGDVLGQVRIG